MNKIILSGYVGKDPESSFSKDGMQITKFSLAVSGYKNKEKTTTWFNCVAFGKTAETVNKYVKKGSHIEVDGACNIDQFDDKDGNKKTWVSVPINSLGFLDKKSDDNHDAYIQKPKPTKQTQEVEEDDVPF